MDRGFKLKELKNIGRPLRLDDLKKERSQKILAAIDRKKPLQLIVAVRNARVSGNAENKSYFLGQKIKDKNIVPSTVEKPFWA
uniref:Uncharacterized protein n=1 Tax=Rhodnius prolixus TaxID=13249 RepID=T1I922_RHOPR